MTSKFLNYAVLAVSGMFSAFLCGGFWTFAQENSDVRRSSQSISEPTGWFSRKFVFSDFQLLSPQINAAAPESSATGLFGAADSPRVLHNKISRSFKLFQPENAPDFQNMFSAMSETNSNGIPNEREQRKDIFQRLHKRAESFRLSASRLGFVPVEAERLLRNGWSDLTENRPDVRNVGSEIDYLLAALDALPDSDGVCRAKDFIQTGENGKFSWPQYSAREQWFFAAFQLTEKELVDWSQVDSDRRLLCNWKNDSINLVLSAVRDQSLPDPYPFSPENTQEIALFSGASSIQNFKNSVAFSHSLPAPFEDICDFPEYRFPKISFFKEAHKLSAGRKPFLLI